MVINNFSRSENVYRQTEAIFQSFPDKRDFILDNIFAYKAVGSAVPHTTVSFMSGHYFPFAESEYEIESSFNLMMQGFYGYALVALRSVLELGLLSNYFAVEGRSHEDVRPWLESKERTPYRKTILSKLSKLRGWDEFDRKFGFNARIKTTFDALDRFVHTRGYEYSSRRLTHVNYNAISLDSIQLYSDHLSEVTTSVIIATILMYPLALTPLPVTDKFGYRPPLGGFMEEYQVERIKKVLCPAETELLEELSLKHPGVKVITDLIYSMPDLTNEEIEIQLEQGFEGFSFPDPSLFEKFRIDQ